MRSQGVLIKIIALLALISLALPASARVASCMASGQKMACCQSHQAPQVKVKPVEDCCHPTVQSASSHVQTLEGKAQCHCAAKPVPSPQATVSVLNFGGELIEVILLQSGELLPIAEPVKI